MNKEVFEVWSTKYALTSGIKKWSVQHVGSGMVSVVGVRYPTYLHTEGRDWHRSFDAAKARAETMRIKKITSLHLSISKLEALKFEVKG